MKQLIMMFVLAVSTGLVLPTIAVAKTNVEKETFIKKLKADDGTNFGALEKEAASFKSGRFGLPSDVKDALWGVRKRSKALLVKLSAADRFGFKRDDVFDDAKVIEAFSKVSKADLFKMPKNWKEREIYPYKLNKPKQNFAIKKPKVSFFKDRIKYAMPATQLPADTVVLFWKDEGNRWIVVTPSGVPFSIEPLRFSHRGVTGTSDGNWKQFGFSFVSIDQAEKLVELGEVAKKNFKKLESANAKLLKCNASINKKAFAKRKQIKNKNADRTVRKEKLKTLHIKTEKTRDSKCGSARTKVEKALFDVGTSIEKKRTATLEKVMTLE